MGKNRIWGRLVIPDSAVIEAKATAWICRFWMSCEGMADMIGKRLLWIADNRVRLVDKYCPENEWGCENADRDQITSQKALHSSASIFHRITRSDISLLLGLNADYQNDRCYKLASCFLSQSTGRSILGTKVWSPRERGAGHSTFSINRNQNG